MVTIEYLDAVKARYGLASDYALAKKLGFPQTTVSGYRNGRRVFDDDAALTVAQALDLNPLVVIAHANAERATTPEKRARWEVLASGFRLLLSQAKPDGLERRRVPRLVHSATAG